MWKQSSLIVIFTMSETDARDQCRKDETWHGQHTEDREDGTIISVQHKETAKPIKNKKRPTGTKVLICFLCGMF